MALKNQLHRLRYFCTDAWEEWRHSLGVNLMALSTLAAALFVAGLVMLIVGNIERRVQTLRDDVKIEVYLKDGQEQAARVALTRHLSAMHSVERVLYIDKEEALGRYREWAADLAQLVNELESNPLPASLEVFLTPGQDSAQAAASIASGLKGHEAVEDVRFNLDWLERLESVLSMARLGGGAVVTLVSIAVVLVMGSVLRLAVYARREEIGIMQLVGATPGFIRGPYLVAGAAQGLVASVLALLVVEAVRSGAAASVDPSAAALVGLVAAQPLSIGMAGVLLLLGLVVSLAGSYVSVRPSV